MDLEKLIFIILILVLSIVSMFLKAKKQKQSTPEKMDADSDLSYDSNTINLLNSTHFLKSADTLDLHKNSNIAPKNEKKKQKPQNLIRENSQKDNSKTVSQNIDLESENNLLEDFEGSELQKAFLYSEIFKNSK